MVMFASLTAERAGESPVSGDHRPEPSGATSIITRWHRKIRPADAAGSVARPRSEHVQTRRKAIAKYSRLVRTMHRKVQTHFGHAERAEKANLVRAAPITAGVMSLVDGSGQLRPPLPDCSAEGRYLRFPKAVRPEGGRLVLAGTRHLSEGLGPDAEAASATRPASSPPRARSNSRSARTRRPGMRLGNQQTPRPIRPAGNFSLFQSTPTRRVPPFRGSTGRYKVGTERQRRSTASPSISARCLEDRQDKAGAGRAVAKA